MQIRPYALVPLLLSFVAFILALLCVFAGSKRGYLENADLLTLNTSMLGRPALNTSKSHSPLLNSIESSIKGDINGLIADVAKGLHIHDFYSAHILDYCEVSRRSKYLGASDTDDNFRDSSHLAPSLISQFIPARM